MHIYTLLQLSLITLATSQKYAVKTPPLTTDYTDKVGIHPWPYYPRPKLERSQWQSLNGIWTYANASSLDAVDHPPFGKTLQQEVLVPFCLESGLSGIQGDYLLYSWYRTTFSVPSNWTGDRVLLGFGAVDYEATVFVNGHNATFNRGGYFGFSVDITHFLKDGQNELIVFAHDPTDSDDYVIPIGKQSLQPSHIFYRPCSGIWQTVFIESAGDNYITAIDINGDASGNLNMTLSASQNNNTEVQVTVYPRNKSGPPTYGCNGQPMTTYSGKVGTPFSLKVNGIQPWSPESPSLYDVQIRMGKDEVQSYTGFRTVGRADVNGVQRIMLNGSPYFPLGTLDQGYWPDGLYTAPTYDAMVSDIKTLKRIGYNSLRKHMKVEPALYYSACDELGILVIQDMPALRPLQHRVLKNCTSQTILPNHAQQQEFQRQLEVLIKQQRSYTSIFAWVIYNEGWGQQATVPPYPDVDLTNLVRELDPTRLIDSTSGWYSHIEGSDFSDNHHYSDPQCGTPFYSIDSSPFDPARIGFSGEFGGIGQNVSIEHLWNVQEAIKTINQTYEIDQTIDIWNYRGHFLLNELLQQVEKFACAGAIWTQTTDVEGEVNGMMTYDRRILRPYLSQWNADIQAVYEGAASRVNASIPAPTIASYPTQSPAGPWPGISTFWPTFSWMPAGPVVTQGYGFTPGGFA